MQVQCGLKCVFNTPCYSQRCRSKCPINTVFPSVSLSGEYFPKIFLSTGLWIALYLVLLYHYTDKFPIALCVWRCFQLLIFFWTNKPRALFFWCHLWSPWKHGTSSMYFVILRLSQVFFALSRTVQMLRVIWSCAYNPFILMHHEY